MGAYQNWAHVHFLQLAKTLHKPIAYYGRSIGPFPERTSKEKDFKTYSFDLLKSLGFISLRDTDSIKSAALAASMYNARNAANTRAKEILSAIINHESLSRSEKYSL